MHPDILEFTRLMVRRMAGHGVPMYAHCLYRTPEQQLREFEEGDSKVRFGPHNVGCAVDLVHGVHGWNMDRKAWELIGHIGQELITQKGLALVSLAWGGDWKFYDPAHWEIRDWKLVADQYPWPNSGQ